MQVEVIGKLFAFSLKSSSITSSALFLFSLLHFTFFKRTNLFLLFVCFDLFFVLHRENEALIWFWWILKLSIFLTLWGSFLQSFYLSCLRPILTHHKQLVYALRKYDAEIICIQFIYWSEHKRLIINICFTKETSKISLPFLQVKLYSYLTASSEAFYEFL